jgi:hypothetical protein
MRSNNPSFSKTRFSSVAAVGVSAALQLATGAGSALAGTTYYVGTANGGVWKTSNCCSAGASESTFNFGSAGMLPFVGDWDGDGQSTAGIYDTSGMFYLRNSNSTGAPDEVLTLNGPGLAQPIAGDWDGDGDDTVGLFDPAAERFILWNSHTSGSDSLQYNFGGIEGAAAPVAGDWDGDGVDTVGLYDPSTGTFHLRNAHSSTAGTFTLTFQGQTTGGVPVAGDWDGDGLTTLGVYEPATGTWSLKNSFTSGPPDIVFTFSRGGLPVAGANSPTPPGCDSVDFDCDGDLGTDADIEAFFACLAGSCPAATCGNDADFNNDGDLGTDADIEAFFRLLGGGGC